MGGEIRLRPYDADETQVTYHCSNLAKTMLKDDVWPDEVDRRWTGKREGGQIRIETAKRECELWEEDERGVTQERGSSCSS